MDNRSIAVALVLILLSPLAGSIAVPSANSNYTPLDSTGFQLIEEGQTTEIPIQEPIWWDSDLNWWEHTSLDSDRNGIHDSLQTEIGLVNVGISYSRDVTNLDKNHWKIWVLISTLSYQLWTHYYLGMLTRVRFGS